MKLLFVCSGNTCRSPLALAAWRALPSPPAGVEAASAGLVATTGEPATGHVLTIARSWNVDLADHRARPLDDRLLRDSDLICVMTPDHAHTLLARGERRKLDITERVALLGSFAVFSPMADEGARRWQSMLPGEGQGQPAWDDDLEAATILDPFGGSREAYQSCAAQIERAVAGLRYAIVAGRFGAI